MSIVANAEIPKKPLGDSSHHFIIPEIVFETRSELKQEQNKTKPAAYFSSDKLIYYKNFKEIPDSDDYFNIKTFFHMNAIYFIYHYLFGPASLLIIIPIFGKAIAHNLGMTFWNIRGLKNFLQYFLLIFEISLYLSKYPTNDVLIVEVLMFIGGYMMMKSLECVSLATMGPNKIKYMMTYYLTEEEWLNEANYAHFEKKRMKNFVEEELHASLERRDIDVSLFQMTFLGKIEDELLKEINSFQKAPRNKDEKNIGSDVSFFSNRYSIYSGVNVAKTLVKRAYESNTSPKVLKAICLLLGIFYSLLPSFFRIYMKNSFFGASPIEAYLIISLMLLNIYYYYKNCVLLIFTFYEYNSFLILRNQLTNLLACKKDLKFESNKLFPTMDFFYPLTVKSWGILDVIFREYGKKYKIRINCYLTLYTLANILAAAFLLFSFYGNKMFNWTYIIVVIYELAIFIVFAILILLKGAEINSHFDIHRGYVKANLDIINDLKNHYLFFFEQEEICPENIIYKEGVERIKTYSEELMLFFNKKCEKKKDKHDHKLKKLRIDLLKNISKAHKCLIGQLKYGLETEQLQLLGITVNSALVNSLIAIVGSLLVASLQGIFENFYEENVSSS